MFFDILLFFFKKSLSKNKEFLSFGNNCKAIEKLDPGDQGCSLSAASGEAVRRMEQKQKFLFLFLHTPLF